VTLIRCGGLCCVRLVSHYLNDIPCKNYVFAFVKVMPKILLVPFFLTRYRTVFSLIFLVYSGVKQDGALSPALFCICIDGLLDRSQTSLSDLGLLYLLFCFILLTLR